MVNKFVLLGTEEAELWTVYDSLIQLTKHRQSTNGALSGQKDITALSGPSPDSGGVFLGYKIRALKTDFTRTNVRDADNSKP